jgi:hypothetical protein
MENRIDRVVSRRRDPSFGMIVAGARDERRGSAIA